MLSWCGVLFVVILDYFWVDFGSLSIDCHLYACFFDLDWIQDFFFVIIEAKFYLLCTGVAAFKLPMSSAATLNLNNLCMLGTCGCLCSVAFVSVFNFWVYVSFDYTVVDVSVGGLLAFGEITIIVEDDCLSLREFAFGLGPDCDLLVEFEELFMGFDLPEPI